MSNIQYDRSRKTVRQHLGTLSVYDFEGDFGSVLNKMMAEYQNYLRYTKEPQAVTEKKYSGGAYLDGSITKTVKFDRLYIDLADGYDNDREYRVMGERALDADELAALKGEFDAQKEREIEQLKALKAKYPGV